MTWTITPTNLLPDDADAVAYIAAVEAADGEALEPAVRLAINSFIKGCKADGIWPAIKASCILAGARTLNGALVPLVGAAPTNFNFVAGDYNRKTGLVGDGSTKYLDSNRNNNADPQNSKHIAVYASTAINASSIGAFSGNTASGASWIARDATASYFRVNSSASVAVTQTAPQGFIGISRFSSSTITYRVNSVSVGASQPSGAPENLATNVFRQGAALNFTSARLAFYSIGEALDLALLDTRVTALVNAFGAAIP